MVDTDPILFHGPGSEPVTDTGFAVRLVALPKTRCLTPQVLADRAGAHVSNLRRYEAGTSQPTLDVLRNLALALNTIALLFDPDQRGAGDDLRLQSEATNHLDHEGKHLVKAFIEGALPRHEARRWTTNAS
jgi:transcriptional regulator with XRE-family HTH domain